MNDLSLLSVVVVLVVVVVVVVVVFVVVESVKNKIVWNGRPNSFMTIFHYFAWYELTYPYKLLGVRALG